MCWPRQQWIASHQQGRKGFKIPSRTCLFFECFRAIKFGYVLVCRFHTEVHGHSLAAEKELDEDSKFEDQHTKEEISDLQESNDDAERYANMIATVEDAKNDQDTAERSGRSLASSKLYGN